MSYKFDDEVKKVELTTPNLKHLDHCDSCIRGVLASIATPERVANARNGHWVGVPITPEIGDREISRLEKARKDIVKRLTKDEKDLYKQYVNESKPRELTKEEQAARTKQMNMNKDRVSH